MYFLTIGMLLHDFSRVGEGYKNILTPPFYYLGVGMVTGCKGRPSVLRFLGQHSEALGHSC